MMFLAALWDIDSGITDRDVGVIILRMMMAYLAIMNPAQVYRIGAYVCIRL